MKRKYETKSGVEGYAFTAQIAGRDKPFAPSFPYETEDVHEQQLLDAQDALKSSNVKEESPKASSSKKKGSE